MHRSGSILLLLLLSTGDLFGQDPPWSVTVDTIQVIETRQRDDMTIRFCDVGYGNDPQGQVSFVLLFSRSIVLSALASWYDTLDVNMRRYNFSAQEIRAERQNTKKAMDFIRAASDTISLAFARAHLDSIFRVPRDADHTRCCDALYRIGTTLLRVGEVHVLEGTAIATRIYLFRTVDNREGDVIFSTDFALATGLRIWNVEWSCGTVGPP